MDTFADRLKIAMERQGMKQVDLIRAAANQGIKLGKSHISQYVSGKTIPRADMLRFLASTLQVEEDWLSGKTVWKIWEARTTFGLHTPSFLH